jgi:alkanesulfonate monooxygenase SsuD/methylene tetrahydromethanopterin reductase-like flavin-dependent oxidoreductase (luciferase family)
VLTVTPGSGSGSSRSAGVPFEERGQRFEELVDALRAAFAA